MLGASAEDNEAAKPDPAKLEEVKVVERADSSESVGLKVGSHVLIKVGCTFLFAK